MGYRMGIVGVLALLCALSGKAGEGESAAKGRRGHPPLYRGEARGGADREVRAAIRRYQVLHGLPANGVADGETLWRLDPSPDPGLMEADRRFLRDTPGPFRTGL